MRTSVYRKAKHSGTLARALVLAVFACTIASLAALIPVAYAAPQSSDAANTGGLDIGTLSDRYDSLNKLENSLNEEESVVIDTRVAVLVSVNRALDGSEVRFTGEVVGDIVNAENGYKWINVMGSANNVISVHVTDEQAKLVQHIGNYHNSGTVLRVTGEYHVACPKHQGELDVHASSIDLVDAGGPVEHLLNSGRVLAAIMLVMLALIVLSTFIILRLRRGRRTDP